MKAEAHGLLDWLRGASVGALLAFRAVTKPSADHRLRPYGGYSKAYATYLADCQKQFAEQRPKTPLTGRLAAVVETVIQRPKTTKLTDPRPDADNLAKAPLDGATKARLWGDDGQIVALGTTKRFTEPGEEHGVVLWIGALPAV